MSTAKKPTGKSKHTMRQATSIDTHVGRRMRQRRLLLGLSQQDLAESVGLTFQQMQKYENGTNRVSASRLFDLARVLDVPVPWFFDGLEPKRATGGTKHGGEPADAAEPMTSRETLELVRIYYQIQDPKVRRKLYEMAKALAVQ